jgi:CheY-like chemotaxis protein
MSDLKQFSILIAEDDRTDQFLLKQAIKEINDEIDINLVYNYDQLLDFLLKDDLQRDLNRQVLPDLIIATYSNPFCDLKIIADIKRKEHFRELPVYVFVNENIKNTEILFLEFGVTKVFQKPTTYKALKQTLQRIITGLPQAN